MLGCSRRRSEPRPFCRCSRKPLAALLLAGAQPPWLLVTVASLGNVLGSVINWLLGRASSASVIGLGFRQNGIAWRERSAGISVTANGRSC